MGEDSPHKSGGDVRFVKVLAEYRLGHFAAAAEWLKKVAPKKEHRNRNVEVQMVLAIAQHFFGQSAGARVTLDSRYHRVHCQKARSGNIRKTWG
jgi:hypothetical protein